MLNIVLIVVSVFILSGSSKEDNHLTFFTRILLSLVAREVIVICYSKL